MARTKELSDLSGADLIDVRDVIARVEDLEDETEHPENEGERDPNADPDAPVAQMQSAARAAKAWEEKRCNVPMDEGQQKRGADRMARLQIALNARLAFAHLCDTGYRGHSDGQHPEPAKVSLGGDPRGPCARLYIPGQTGDGWGEGFAIY